MLPKENIPSPAAVSSRQRVAKTPQREKAMWRALEWFAGIGGFACAVESALPNCRIEAAIDIDRQAAEVYRLHWPAQYHVLGIESISASAIRRFEANLWWMSPPCQPYSRRGLGRDIDDPRSAPLLHLINLIPTLLPEAIGLENVVEFGNSRAFQLLNQTLRECGYHVSQRELCPTEMGWPNRRPRFYLLASRTQPIAWQPLPQLNTSLIELLSEGLAIDSDEAIEACRLPLAQQERFGCAMDRVDRHSPDAVAACFGSSYGKSLLRAGSYLVTPSAWRRFTPREVARIMGYPHSLSFPQGYSLRTAWRLLGNSLSIPAMRYVVSHFGPSHAKCEPDDATDSARSRT